MPIKWYTLVDKTGANRRERVEGKEVTDAQGEKQRVYETHAGLVASTAFLRAERVMSDAWADVSYCRVYNPQKGQLEEVCLGHHFELGTVFGEATVDLDPKITARLADRQQKADAAAKAETERLRQVEAEEEALRSLLAPRKEYIGFPFRAIKGRKVPKGATGRLIGVSRDNTRSKVRFADKGGGTSEEWTDSRNLEVYPPGFDPQNPPEASENSNWVLASYIMLTKTQEWGKKWGKGSPHRIRPAGDLKFNAGRMRGRVFWEGGGRIGVKNSKGGEPAWGIPSGFEYEIDGEWVRGEDYFLTVPQPVVSMREMGEPFDSIAALILQRDGTWDAVTADGGTVALFPADALGSTFARR